MANSRRRQEPVPDRNTPNLSVSQTVPRGRWRCLCSRTSRRHVIDYDPPILREPQSFGQALRDRLRDLVGTTKVYSGVGADIVMESISLIENCWVAVGDLTDLLYQLE